MKSLFFIIVLVTTNYSFSQGNLQFNQVYNYLGSTIPVYGPTQGQVTHWSITYTVPQNKVWKIEYMTASAAQTLYINDLFASNIIVNGTATYPPIWVREGNTIKTYSGNYSGNYHINIVEFNIIP